MPRRKRWSKTKPQPTPKQKLNKARAELTAKMIAMMEDQSFTWSAAFVGGALPFSASTGEIYNGFNAIYLAVLGVEAGYTSNQWGTFHAWKAKGGYVRSGEKSSQIFFGKNVVNEDKDTSFWCNKYYNVFNRNQIDGMEEEESENDGDVILQGSIYNYFQAENITVQEALKAAYVPSKDKIILPPMAAWKEESTAWSTVAHEAIHSTGHKSRLSREGVINFDKFGSHQYSYEELVAELGSVFLCSHLKHSSDKSEKNSSAYLSHWMKVLKENQSWLWRAASEASKASDFILERL